MPTRSQRGGRHRDHLALRRSPPVLALYVNHLRNHPALRPTHDDPLRGLLLRPLRWWYDCRQLADVAHQALVLVPHKHDPVKKSLRKARSGFCGHSLASAERSSNAAKDAVTLVNRKVKTDGLKTFVQDILTIPR